MSRVHLESGQMQGQCIEEFNKLKKKLKENGCFVIISNSEFIVGDIKYYRQWKRRLSAIGPHGQHLLGVFTSMDEVEAFAIGFVASKNKKWK